MPLPIRSAAHEAGAASGGVDRVFERFPVPGGAFFFRILPVPLRLQHFEGGIAVVREIAVDADPAIAHWIEPAQRVPLRRRRPPIDTEVARAAKRGRSGAQIDCDVLPR